jgi:hypothetical protein
MFHVLHPFSILFIDLMLLLHVLIRILTVMLMLYRIRGAILIGIFFTSIVSWPRPTAVTYFPHTPAGDALFDYFKQVVNFRSLQKVGNVIDVSLFIYCLFFAVFLTSPVFFSTIMGKPRNWRGLWIPDNFVSVNSKGKVWYALITFLYVDILGTSFFFLTSIILINKLFSSQTRPGKTLRRPDPHASLTSKPDLQYIIFHGEIRWSAGPRHTRFRELHDRILCRCLFNQYGCASGNKSSHCIH